MKRILLVPSIRRHWGTGHIVRCSKLLAELGPETKMFIPFEDTEQEWGWKSLFALFGSVIPEDRVLYDGEAEDRWDLVVFDRRSTNRRDFLRFAQDSPTLGIDEGGEARSYCSYLIDGFPRLHGEAPNFEDTGFVTGGIQRPRREPPEKIGKVLLTFGGEDPADLTGKTMEALIQTGLVKSENIDVVEGPAFHKPVGIISGNVYRGLNDIRHLFADYDIVITSFGITPYEALSEGVVTILVNPSAYHEKLAKKAGFSSLGVGKPNLKKLEEVLKNPEKTIESSARISTECSINPASFIEGLKTSGSKGCPACGSRDNKAVHRQKEKTYFRCSRCGIAYMESFFGDETRYEKEYFFEEYSRQYGKTYLEDFDKIRLFARERLTEMEKVSSSLTGKTLLDIGCAYGPFLVEAATRGLFPFGVDMAEDAVRYIRESLAIPAWSGNFLGFNPEEAFGIKKFDVITLWYVIEHFRELDSVLKKIKDLLKTGGIFAFSTPNGKGISEMVNEISFFENSPKDHFSVWDPSSARTLLKKYGFEVKRIRITGHHPERFPEGFRKVLGKRILGMMSGFFGLGDTFEVYAEKK